MMHYGIASDLWTSLLTICFNCPSVDRVILYGSRARGDFQEGSDIDLAVDASNMSAREFSVLWNALDDLPIIFKQDVVHLQALTNDALRQAINKEGHVFSRTRHPFLFEECHHVR